MDLQRFRLVDSHGRVHETHRLFERVRERAEELSSEIAYLAIVDADLIAPGDDGEIWFHR